LPFATIFKPETFLLINFYKLLVACCQDYELNERLDRVEKANVVEVGEDVRETGGGVR